MSTASSSQTPSAYFSHLLMFPLELLVSAAFEPLVTGPLLATLLYTRSSDAQNHHGWTIRQSTTFTLQVLLVIGIILRLNAILNTLSLRHYRLKNPGAPFTFSSPTSSEIVLITGGCSGFGLHMINHFSRLTPSTRLVILDISPLPPSLKKNPNIHYYHCDLTSGWAINNTYYSIKKDLGNPTVLINNAGIGNTSPILKLPRNDLLSLFAVNLFSHYALVQLILPSMLSQRKGHIVSLASMAAFMTLPNMVDYCASKAAVLAFHEGLTSELKQLYWEKGGMGVRTTCVHPIWSETGLTGKWMGHLRGKGQMEVKAEDVAELIVKIVLSGESGGRVCVPSRLSVVSGVRWLPGWAQELVRGMAASATKGV